MRAPFTPEPRRTWRFRRSGLLPEPIPNAHDGGDHICVALTPTDFYLVLVASGKAAELGLTLPAIRAWYAEGLPDAPRRARRDLCAGCPFASTQASDAIVEVGTPSSATTAADGIAARADAIAAKAEAIAVPNWPTRHTPIDRPQGERT
jgi:hypothetical protein